MNKVLFTIIMLSFRILAVAVGTVHCGLNRDTVRMDSAFVADTIPLADVTVVASVPANAEKLEWFSSLDSTYCCDFMLGNGRLIQVKERGVSPSKVIIPAGILMADLPLKLWTHLSTMIKCCRLIGL